LRTPVPLERRAFASARVAQSGSDIAAAADRPSSRIARVTVLKFRPIATSRPPTPCLCTALIPASGTMLLLLVYWERLGGAV
jgi:hypothetical protein